MHPIRRGVGRTIERYELLRRIGSGGAGTVYEAVDLSLGRHVALKLLHPRDAGSAHAQRAEARFLREGLVAAQSRHPHVVDVFDVGMEDGQPYLVMELVDGETLAELLGREGRLDVARASEIVLPILSAVWSLHESEIIHRDIKPANILMAGTSSISCGAVGRSLWPKLADFGASLCDDDAQCITHPGGVVGTPEYMAPELIRSGQRASERSDQYALGVLLYECTTGQRPFGGSTPFERMHAAVSGELVPPSERAPSLPAAFDAVVLRAMSRDPAERYASVEELGAALLPFAAEPVAARWRDEFAAPIRPALPAARAVAHEGDPPSLVTYDGVAVATRGDTLTMLWKAPARLPRSRWAFDLMDQLAARCPGGILVLMIDPADLRSPDRAARLENERRLGHLRTSIRAASTVVVGDGMWQVLVRSVLRAMLLPHRRSASGFTSIESTFEPGIARLRPAAGPSSPSSQEVFEDVRALHRALDLTPPEHVEVDRTPPPARLRPSGRSQSAA